MQTGLSIKNSYMKNSGNAGKASMPTFGSGSLSKQKAVKAGSNSAGAKSAKQAAGSKNSSRMRDIRQGLKTNTSNYEIINGKKTFTSKSKTDVLQSSSIYSDALRAQRTGNKKAQTQVKTLKYSFKSISSKLLRSKTSVSARQVASQAKREVTRLKNLKKVEGYDPEELEAAITHAKAMERLAKKKARHLEEEEMAKIGGACLGEEMEKEEIAEEVEDEELLQTSDYEDMSPEEIEALMANMPEIMADLPDISSEAESLSSDILELSEEQMALMEDMMDDLDESMQDMMEELGLDELFEDMTGSATDMDPEDLKMMKIKHRTKEQQDQAKADAEYLKAIFKHLEAMKAAGGVSLGTSNQNPMPVVDMTGGGIVTEAAAVVDAATVEAHVDVSL